MHASALGNEAIARKHVEELRDALVENGRSAIEATVGHAYYEGAKKLDELLNRPPEGSPWVNDVLDGA